MAQNVLNTGAALLAQNQATAKLGSRDPRGIGSHWLDKPDVVIFPDGREVCNPATLGGQYEYNMRIALMCVRQYDPAVGFVRCCNCRRRLRMCQATFEHEFGRTKARRDDRIVIFDENGRLLRYINGASHEWCNAERGSKRTPIWHGNNCIVEAA